MTVELIKLSHTSFPFLLGRDP